MQRLAQLFWRTVDAVTYNWNADRPRFWWKVVLGSSVAATGLILHFGRGDVNPDEPQYAWVQVGLMVLSIGLSYLAGQMLAKKDDPLQSDKPTTLATRGSFTPWHVGIRRIGPVFSWAGQREIRKEKPCGGGGKGIGGAPDAEINYEAGWHILGIGPMYALHSIIQSGKVIFKGPITADSHPSGTTVDLGKEGAFTIYWGEPDQPINNFLGNASRVGISSRWPYACYVHWNKKRMAGGAWSILDYELERRPSWAGLSQSQGWYEPIRTLTGASDSVTFSNSDADQDVGFLTVDGDRTGRYRPSEDIELTSTGLADGTYEVLRSETLLAGDGDPDYETFTTKTRIFLVGGTLGVTTSGSVQSWQEDETDGANIAHVIGEVLFADWPLGLQKDPAHIVEGWDLDSLEALGVEAEAASWRAAIMGSNGETAEAMLGAMLQDHGTMLPIDASSGLMLFQRVREPVGTLKALVTDIYAENLPEVEVVHGEQPVDRLIFSFNDRTRQYGDMTIAIDEDGQASYNEYSRARKVAILSTTQFPTAAALAELRSPEELAPGASMKLSVSREARDILPGEAVTAEGFDEVLRVTAVEVDPLSERTQLTVMPDFYGVPLSTFQVADGQPPATTLDPEMDEAFIWAEIPEQLLASGFGSSMVAMVPRIRNHNLISFSSIHLSDDNVTYTLKATDLNVQTGGTLDAALPPGTQFSALGPVFTELGPDNANAADYSADLTSWGLGRQLAVIHSPAGTEICIVQKTTIVSGTQRRLDGLLRSRYDTRQLNHPIGATVYIIDSNAITEIQDGLLEPALDLWAKSQPGSSTGQVNLSAVPPYGELLVGKGQVPITPDYVHVRAPARNVPAFQTGDNITVSWAISSGSVNTGCGGQSAGVSVGSAVIPGTVQIELLTTGDAVQATISVDPSTVTEYEITNAALVAAFTSEPSAFKVRVTHIANGYSSPVSPSLTITRV